ncbi:glycerophosphoryl diester phosphodiesterase membrane domain-containing protein [Kineococcus sp. SYSU DK002]|uniref:glycerophosphoryl diester phosphodiesterase membrane domain-containing protein n=1 Tax=Kineococcus sp. SYSU DK002 TaxID=3383123 RepID=UPI003D7D1B97
MGSDQWQRPDEGPGGGRDGWDAPRQPPPTGWGQAPAGPVGTPGPPQRPVAPRPGIVPLRPLGLGEIWDGAFRAFRQNPKVMVGLSAIVVVITSIAGLVASFVTTRDLLGVISSFEAGDGSADELFSTVQRSVPLLVLSGVLQLVAVQALNGMLIVSVSRAVIGRTVGFGELWALCRPRLLRLIALSIVITVASVAVGAVTLAPGIALVALSGSDLVTGVGVVALLLGVLAWAAGGAYLWVKWSMATPAMLLEGLGVGASMKRSFGLTRRSFWRLLGIQLLTAVVVYFVVAAVSVPFGAVGGVVSALFSDPTGSAALAAQQSIATLGSMIGSIVAYPFLASVTALLYVDLRMRREGLDVELHRAATR